MTGTLSLADLVTDHKLALGTTANKFSTANDADFERHIINAGRALSRVRRRTLVAELSLVADQANYDAPADMLLPKTSQWGQGRLNPWDHGYARLPRMRDFDSDTGTMINLSPAPTAAQIAMFGSTYAFFYLAAHHIDALAANTTVKDADRDLLLLFALIESMIELVARGISEPVQLHRGMGSTPANNTPAAFVELLTKQVELRK